MVNCSVAFCTSRNCKATRSLGITFHEYPSNEERRESWIKAVFRKDPCSNGYWKPKDYDVVCSLHFTSESFKHTPKRRVLKPGSIPTIFPGYPTYTKTGKSLAKRRRIVRKKKEEQIPPTSHNATEPELVSKNEMPICNENLLLEDLAEVNQNYMLDINSKCTKSVPSISSTTAEMKCKQLKSVDMQTGNYPANVGHIVRLDRQISPSSHNATEPEFVSETEATIYNDNFLGEDLTEVHQNHTLDMNLKNSKSVSTISSTATEMKCKLLKTRYETASRKIRRLNAKMRKLEQELQKLRDDNKSLDNRMSRYNICYLEESIKSEDPKALFLKDQLSSLTRKNVLWSHCTIINTALLRSKSPAAYHFLRKMNIITLPGISTLNRHIGNWDTEALIPLKD